MSTSISTTVPECQMRPAHYDKEGWTGRDAIEASAEGWDVFDSGGSENGPFQICMRDDMDSGFLTDEEVWQHVVDEAREGSALHRRALDFVREHNPAEYETIIGHVGA